MTLRLTAEEVRRARGRGQLLGDEPSDRGVPEVLSTLVGVQAQDVAAAGLCLRARTSGLVAADLPAALSGTGEAGQAVLVWSLRGTRHLHHRDDVRWLLGLLGPVFGRPGRRAEQLGIGGGTGRAAVDALRRALVSEGSLTRVQVKERLAPLGVDPSGQAAVHVVHRAALEGALCIVVGADGRERYVPLGDRAPAASAAPVEPGPAAAELARRYLAAFAPAVPADFATWSGLPAAVARRAWSDVAGELTEVEEPGRRSWVLTAVGAVEAAAGAGPLPVRLVGGFDSVVLAYADRRLVVAPEHAGRVNAGGGMIRPVVVADGEVAGGWASRRRGRSHTVAVEPFRPFTRAQRDDVAGEVADVGRYLGTEPALVWVAGGE